MGGSRSTDPSYPSIGKHYLPYQMGGKYYLPYQIGGSRSTDTSYPSTPSIKSQDRVFWILVLIQLSLRLSLSHLLRLSGAGPQRTPVGRCLWVGPTQHPPHWYQGLQNVAPVTNHRSPGLQNGIYFTTTTVFEFSSPRKLDLRIIEQLATIQKAMATLSCVRPRSISPRTIPSLLNPNP